MGLSVPDKYFYRNARAYDIAFSEREYDAECNFLEWCYRKHSKIEKKNKVKSFLELGCGPAQHTREFARRGWRAVALDLSDDMIAFAKEESKREGLTIETIVGDMTNFVLKKRVHLAATLMESISHLVTNEQMISHFKSVAKSLTPGGIYVIEAAHPIFFFPDDEANTWTTKEGDTEVEVTFGLPTDPYNSITQQWLVTSVMKIRQKGEKEIVVESKSPFRWYLAQELKALIELSGVFDAYWFYGSMNYTPPFELDDNEKSETMVIVLRTKS